MDYLLVNELINTNVHVFSSKDQSQYKTKNLVCSSKNDNAFQNSVSVILGKAKEIPERSLLLGKCQDGLPVFLCLDDLTSGAILITCDACYGKTHHLQVIAFSIFKNFPREKFKIIAFSKNPFEWSDLLINDDLLNNDLCSLAWQDPGTKNVIDNLTLIAEERLRTDSSDSDIFVLLDDLEGLFDLEEESQLHLRWLIEYGLQTNIWVIATITPIMEKGMNYWVKTFGTNILGGMTYNELDLGLIYAKSNLLKHGEFLVDVDSGKIIYTLPVLG